METELYSLYKKLVRMEPWEQKLIDQHGWFWTADFKVAHAPMGVDIHTHGLHETYQHPDLQVCLPIALDGLPLVTALLDSLAQEIAAGQHFIPETPYVGVLDTAPVVSFAAVVLEGKQYLRLICADSNGRTDTFPYDTQLRQLTDGSRLSPIYYETWNITTAAEVAQFFFGLNERLGGRFEPSRPLESYQDATGLAPALGPAQVLRLTKMIRHCKAVCGAQYDLDKIASCMASVGEAMNERSWRREPPAKG